MWLVNLSQLPVAIANYLVRGRPKARGLEQAEASDTCAWKCPLLLSTTPKQSGEDALGNAASCARAEV
jgi:hypothetical protein